MSKLVTIYGGSGFAGRYIARRMARAGWRVRVAVRRPNEAMHVRPYGVPGQVEPVFCNIRDDDSVRAAMMGADAVVNCVGTFDRGGRNNFNAVQAEGATRIARIAAGLGIARLVHLSAIGADPASASLYARSKAAGEAGIQSHFPQAVILRPSVIFGAEDQFFNRFAGMTRFSPILPVVGGETRFQPVYVDDVAQAAAKAVMGAVEPGIYELGGPEVATFREWMQVMLGIIRRRRLIVGIPFGVASVNGGGDGTGADGHAWPCAAANHPRPGAQLAGGQCGKRGCPELCRSRDRPGCTRGGPSRLPVAVPACGPIRGDPRICP